ATIVLDFAMARLTRVIEGLVVYPENMLKNIDLTRGLWHSQGVLLALVDKGIARDTAYQWVQRNALQVWEGKADFKDLLKKDEDVVKTLGTDGIDGLFDLSHHLQNVDKIFERVFS
ncbi:adenylosuccinate lyase, partial [bacterium]|nr:adenylosuccinate lyase [bacterium]